MKRENGFVLFVALIMLAALTMIGLALTRAVDATNDVANNIGFLQSTVMSTDRGLEDAVTYLQNNAATLSNDDIANGYYARDIELCSASGMIDYTGSATPSDASDDVDWDGSSGAPHKAKVVTNADGAGNQVSYIIHRLCDAYGTPGGTAASSSCNPNPLLKASVNCAKMSLAATSGSSKGGTSYGGQNLTGKTQVYYRITARARGPRNTASYTQSTIVIEY